MGIDIKNIGTNAFVKCSGLLDVYCYAIKLPSTESDAFDGSNPEKVTLHVPSASVESYKKTEPWSGFANIVALSTEMHNMLAAHELFTGRIIHDIANSVDTTIFTLGDKQKLRCKYGIPMNSYVLLFANAQLNDTEKGLVELVRALEILDNKKLTLLCVGNGQLPKSRIDMIQLPRMSTQEEMAQMYQMADMLVMPSRQEAFALTPLEAMSCGKPVVITPVSGANDLMRTFAGEIAVNFTPEAIAEAIKNVTIKEYDEQQIRNYIVENYNLNIINPPIYEEDDEDEE
jgi:glycosyltransferase involved in cell wall biosynthesis